MSVDTVPWLVNTTIGVQPSMALAPSGSAVAMALPAQSNVAFVYNAAASVMAIAFGTNSFGALAQANLPTPGNTNTGIVIPPGFVGKIRIPPSATWWAANGNGTIYLTIGEGGTD